MTNYSDWLDGEEEDAPSADVTSRVTNLVKEHTILRLEVDALQQEASEKSRRMKYIEQSLIPDALLEAGLSEIKTLDGLKVTTKLFVGSIPSDSKEAAFAWLDEHGHGSLMKNTVTVSFGKGEEELAKKTQEDLKSSGLSPVYKRDIHYQTFSSLVKDLANKGQTPPLDQWGVYYGQKASIKKV